MINYGNLDTINGPKSEASKATKRSFNNMAEDFVIEFVDATREYYQHTFGIIGSKRNAPDFSNTTNNSVTKEQAELATKQISFLQQVRDTIFPPHTETAPEEKATEPVTGDDPVTKYVEGEKPAGVAEKPSIISTAIECVSDIGSCLTGGTPAQTPTIPPPTVPTNNPPESLVGSQGGGTQAGGTASPSAPQTTTPIVDLRTEATSATKGSGSEYRFRGFLTRSIENNNGLPLNDLEKNYSAIIENRLNLDYHCDGEVDAQKSFTVSYRSFSFESDESSLLLSEYLPVTIAGSHCFFFEADTKNVLSEQAETNNRSTRHTFVTGS
jgi:hypothetical protein